jgi:hypothetical protein
LKQVKLQSTEDTKNLNLKPVLIILRLQRRPDNRTSIKAMKNGILGSRIAFSNSVAVNAENQISKLHKSMIDLT